MPRVSDWQKALRFVQRKLELNIALASSSSDNDSDLTKSADEDMMELTESDSDLDLLMSSDSEKGVDPFELEGQPKELFELYFVMFNTRYFVDRPISLKSKDFVNNFFQKLPDKTFRQMARMDKPNFFELLCLIEDHPIFFNESPYNQASVAWQLAVTLGRLGHDGNGACLLHLIPTWGVSNGSLCNFTSRCFTALDSALHGVLRWPDRVERQNISDEFAKKGFPRCVGLIDGTLIPLSQRPKESGECYYDRKCRYSMNAQVICDHRRRILFLYTGMPGTCSDLTCFKGTSLCRDMDKGELFDRSQYILGDSGYSALSHMVASYKRSDTAADKVRFNHCVAKARVTNEHCIGVLKARWFSLKEMRIQLNLPKCLQSCLQRHKIVE